MEKSPQIRILIIDNHPVVREGIKSFLDGQAGFEVVGEVLDPASTPRRVQSLKPDVLILDIPVSEDGGEDYLRRLRKSAHDTKIILFSTKRSNGRLAALFNAGMDAFVAKESTADQLVHAIRAVLNDGQVSEGASSVVLREEFARSYGSGEESRHGLEGLTRRQREILRFLAEGKTVKEIALIMGVSAKTVETHRHRLMHKLGAASVNELTTMAIKYRLSPT